jgi:hypothetical protein
LNKLLPLWRSKIRLVAFVYALGFLATMSLQLWSVIEGGALERPRPHWQEWAIPIVFILGTSALWPLILVLALMQLLGLIKAPITF